MFQAIVHLEQIPASFTSGITIPVYMGKGKDPLSMNSYRGVTLTSVIAKCFEFVLLERLLPILEDNGIPHINQTGFRKESPCIDSMFASYESAIHYCRQKGKIYMMLYDTEKVFDNIEYSVLLDHLYQSGANARMWRLVKSWYSSPTNRVRLGGHGGQLFDPFEIQRGV